MNIETISQLGPLVAAVSAFIAAVGAFFVYRQYTRAQEWRRGDLATSLMKELESNDELAFACISLDWGTGPLVVPTRYRPLVEQMSSGSGAVLQHSPEILALALEPYLNEETEKSAQGLIYRHCFVKLFSHLDNIARLLVSKQIRRADLDGLEYWLKQLSNYQYAPANGEEVFQRALAVFEYPRIPALGRLLQVDNWNVYENCVAEMKRHSN
jgi:hypothetical protein